MSYTPVQTPLYSSTYIWPSSITPSSSASSTGTQSASYSLASSQSLTLLPSPSPSPSLNYLSPSLSPSSSQACKLSSRPVSDPTVLGSISDNTFYSVVVAIIFIFLLNLSYSIHYYNAYTNEKIRRRLVNDQVQNNPYHTNVRDTFIRV